MKKSIFYLLFIVLCPLLAEAQEVSEGDSSVVKDIDIYLSAIYDKHDTTLHFLTKTQLQKIPGTGSKVYAEKKAGNIQRIGIFSMTGKGEFAEEYWFKNGALIFVYQTFGYFKENIPLHQSINFQGIPYWESRYYLVNEQVKYTTSTGQKGKNQHYTTADLIKQKKDLLKFIN